MKPGDKQERADDRLGELKRLLEQHKKQFLIGLGSVTLVGSVTLGVLHVKAHQVPLYSVQVGEEVIGAVSDPQVVEAWLEKQLTAARRQAGGAPVQLSEEVTVAKEPRWVYKGKSQDADVLRTLKEEVDIRAEAVQLVIDGKPVAVLSDQESVDQLLETYQQRYVGGLSRTPQADRSVRSGRSGQPKVKEVGFVQSVTSRPVTVDPDDVMQPHQVAEIIEAGAVAERKHTVQEGDSLWSIASRYDTTVKELLVLNPNITENTLLQPGQQIVVKAKEPLLSVRVVEEVTETKSVPYKTEYVDEPKMYKGEQKVIRQGKNGTVRVTYEVTKVNGRVEAKRAVAEQVVEEPVNQVIAKGTKVVAARGTGQFRWPAIGGYVSSRYGQRGGRMHTGIDIARSASYNIVAADNGRVVFAGWDGAYGYSIIIDHNNGYRTRYAHLRSIKVRVGQVVERGQVIGVMGSTGRSTGTHLHFEVIKNGRTINPLSVL